jgi:hypothetical protein
MGIAAGTERSATGPSTILEARSLGCPAGSLGVDIIAASLEEGTGIAVEGGLLAWPIPYSERWKGGAAAEEPSE